MKTSREITSISVGSLKANPRNAHVHADIDAAGRDAWLLADIETNGVLLPILVTPAGMIVDGHRRWQLAKRAKQDSVPCVVLQEGDSSNAFQSAQLARQLTLFAKCVLYRERIEELIDESSTVRVQNLRAGVEARGRGDSSGTHQSWIEIEEVLCASRRTLMRGVTLLREIAAIAASKDPDEKQRAARVLAIFRNRGLKPALRMLGHKDTADLEEDGNDPGGWRCDDSPEPKRNRKPKAKIDAKVKEPEAEPAEEATEEPTNDAPMTLPMFSTRPGEAYTTPGPTREAWRARVLAYVGRIEGVLLGEAALTPQRSQLLRAFADDVRQAAADNTVRKAA